MRRPARPTARLPRRFLTALWLPALLLGAAFGCEADGGRPIGDSCAEDADCASGVCYQSVCLAAGLDEDDDGVPNAIEARLTTDPTKKDSDGDGFDDLRELRDTRNPADSDGDGIIDALESALLDADDDCLVDQYDPENDVQSAAAANLLAKTCGLGVCGQAPLAAQVAVGCEDGRLVCKRGELGAPYVPEEGADAGCADGLDNDCDGETDEGAIDTDGDEQADCVDDDDDDDDTPDAEDCLPLDARCTTDCSDEDDDGQPDCLALCPADPAQYPVACDDGNDCTTDTCAAETGCLHLTDDLACDDLNPCTDDVCDAEAGCLNEPNGGPCEDGEPCTEGDACVEDACVPGADVCECRVNGDCAGEENDDRCDGTLRCDTGAVPYTCEVDPGTVISCPPGDDDDECRHTVCRPSDGACVQEPFNAGGVCSDGNACTTGDRCVGGLCLGDSQCECESNVDCASLDDGNLCNGTWRCDTSALPFECEFTGPAVTCSATGNTECMENQCVPATGQCELLPANEGGACDDGDACTGDGQCAEGACAPGSALDCDDAIPCTTDSCVAGTGCAHVPDHGLCEDDDPCTANVCDPGAGCTFPDDDTALCDDGNECTNDDHCSGGLCVGTSECACEGDNAECLPYEDGNRCNGTLICDTAAFPYTCVVDPETIVTCDGGQDTACRRNTCNQESGVCALQNINDDGPCDDADPCTTTSFCLTGVCQGGNDVCDCRVDADCEPQEDGDLCNGTLFCDTAAVPYTCELDPATVVTCDTTGDTTCRHTVCVTASGACVEQDRNEDGACQDGDACTSSDTCQSGVCTPGGPTDCDDGNECTVDSCDEVEGCQHADAPDDVTACDDGEPCTDGDACQAGECVPGGPLDCSDADPCTAEVCTPGVGCEYPAAEDETECEDGDLCTAGDTCQGGDCATGPDPTDCDDRVDCTVESCEPDVGCLNTPDPTRCNDQLDCTTNGCDAVTGCFFDPVHALCDDSVPCTVDVCLNVTGCEHTPDDLLCDDAIVCTDDSCDAENDCQHDPNDGLCDDGVDCTDDACDAALDCLNTPNDDLCPDDADPCTDAVCDAGLDCGQVDSGTCACLALVFVGGEEVGTADTAALSGGPDRSFTLEAWVQPAGVTGEQSVLSKVLPDGTGGEWGLFLVDDDFVFRFWPDGSQTPVAVTAADVFAAGTWTHVAAVFDRGANSIKLYVDGSTVAVQGNILDMGDTAAGVSVGPSPNAGTAFSGSLDEVRVWTIARASTDVAADRASAIAGGTPGLAARWAFDDVGTVTTVELGAADFSGGGHALFFGTAVPPTTEASTVILGCPPARGL